MPKRPAGLRQTQRTMVHPSDAALAAIDRIIGVPLADRVRVGSDEYVESGKRRWRSRLMNPQIPKNAMMALACSLVGKQAKKKKYVADANALIAKVRLGSAALSKNALAINEHRVFVAKMMPCDFSPRTFFYKLPKPQHLIRRGRPAACRDWKADRTPGDYRRWRTTRTGIETLPT